MGQRRGAGKPSKCPASHNSQASAQQQRRHQRLDDTISAIGRGDGWDGGCADHFKEAVKQELDTLRVPSGPEQLYGSYLPSHGLHVRLVYKDSTVIYPCSLTSDIAANSTEHTAATHGVDEDITAAKNTVGAGSSSDIDEDHVCAQSTFPAHMHPRNRMHASMHETMHVVPIRTHATPSDPVTHIPGPFELQKLPEETPVVVVSGSEACGNKFSGLLFGDYSCMVFDSTCAGVSITDSLASGGMVVCHGRGCLMTFSNVHFTNCPVMLLAGAKALFQDCTFSRDSTDKECSFAVFAHGPTTCISVLGCVMDCAEGLRNGIIVQHGASAIVESCSIHGAACAAAEVHGVNSVVNCTDLVVDWHDHPAGKGVVAADGAFARLSRTSISAASVGFVASRGVSGVLHEVRVANAGKRGVTVADYSCLTLDACSVYETVGEAVVAEHHSEVSVLRCTLRGNLGLGVGAADHSVARISECKCDDNPAGFAALLGSMMFLRDSSTTRCSIGVHMEQSGSCVIEDVTTKRCGTGFQLNEPRGSVVLSHCSSKLDKKYAIIASGGDETIQLLNCHFEPEPCSGNAGLAAKTRARICAVECSLHCVGLGAAIMSPGTLVQMHECKITAFCGVVVREEARVELTSCETSRCEKFGVSASSGASVSLLHCMSHHDRTSVQCTDASLVMESFRSLHCFMGAHVHGGCETSCTIRHSTFFSAYPYSTGVMVEGSGITLEVSDCKFTGSEVAKWPSDARTGDYQQPGVEWKQYSHSSQGVHMDGTSHRASFRRCHFVGHKHSAVWCAGGDVRLQQCHSSRNRACGYIVMNGATMQLIQCSSCLDMLGCCVGLMSSVQAHLLALEQDCPDIQNPTRLIARELLVHRAEVQGLVVSGAVNCILQNCCVHKCGTKCIPHAAAGIQIDGYTGQQGRVNIISCTSNSNGREGVFVKDKAHAHIRDVVARGNKGAGFSVKKSGSKVTMQSCESIHNGRAYKCSGGAVLECHDCTPAPGDV